MHLPVGFAPYQRSVWIAPHDAILGWKLTEIGFDTGVHVASIDKTQRRYLQKRSREKH